MVVCGFEGTPPAPSTTPHCQLGVNSSLEEPPFSRPSPPMSHGMRHCLHSCCSPQAVFFSVPLCLLAYTRRVQALAVRLPLNPSSCIAVHDATLPAADDGSGVAPAPLTPLVLLVEDDRQMRKYLRGALADHGLRVVETETGSDALAQASARNPDLVVLDLGLPDIDGIQVTTRLRQWTAAP